MDKSLLPSAGNRPTTLPGVANGNRPSVGNRPSIGNRPSVGNRPDFSDRSRWGNNNVISNRPRWANIDNSTNVNIRNNWNNAFTRPQNPGWWDRPRDRVDYWHGWGNGVRDSWRYYNNHNGWYNDRWWNNHRFAVGGWHYHYWNTSYGWNYWWRRPAWIPLTGWFVWTANVNGVWQQPVYYDYGTGGNVVYQDNSVYVGGERIASADDYAASAMELATVEPPASEAVAETAEWMPLGTFALSMNAKDAEPNMTLQLAVNKQGVVSGTLWNMQSDESQAIQGQVDKDSQRVAFRLGESEEIVAEAGLYNLTQDEVPLLVHYGTDRTETYLLVRLEEPEGGESTP